MQLIEEILLVLVDSHLLHHQEHVQQELFLLLEEVNLQVLTLAAAGVVEL
jgi:hypothetical protein